MNAEIPKEKPKLTKVSDLSSSCSCYSFHINNCSKTQGSFKPEKIFQIDLTSMIWETTLSGRAQAWQGHHRGTPARSTSQVQTHQTNRYLMKNRNNKWTDHLTRSCTRKTSEVLKQKTYRLFHGLQGNHRWAPSSWIDPERTPHLTLWDRERLNNSHKPSSSKCRCRASSLLRHWWYPATMFALRQGAVL